MVLYWYTNSNKIHSMEQKVQEQTHRIAYVS